MIVGTAGHIDHGKTSLVKALTGTDTDRLKEEKARGITIELGFAYSALADGGIIGFVDVPGHERLVHTMLAGAAGIDFVLLVVAADDGVMPQTREHVDILRLLGLEEGVVAITKADLVDAARLAEVEGEVRALLAGTGLAGADMYPVSSATGAGIAALDARLRDEALSRPERAVHGAFRMAVDRSFTLAGAGTVVTGSIAAGRVAVGDQVVVLPQGLAARVRSLHAQGRPAERAEVGERAALNLTGAGITRDAISRGDWIADPSRAVTTARFDASLTLLAGERRPLETWSPVFVHVGTSAEIGRVVILSGEGIAPGGMGLAQLVLPRPLPVRHGDRLVLRDVAASRTIGGGRVIDPSAPQRRRRTPERLARLDALAEPDLLAALDRLLELPPGIVDVGALANDRGVSDGEIDGALDTLEAHVLGEGGRRYAASAATKERLTAAIAAALAAHHAAEPALPGMPPARLRLAIEPRLAMGVLEAVIGCLVAGGEIKVTAGMVHLPGHASSLAAADLKLWDRVRPVIEASRLRPPTAREIAEAISNPVANVRRVCKTLARMGELVEVAGDRFFQRAALIELGRVARGLADASPEATFTAAEFRDKAGCGRNVGIQVLEYFDRVRLTARHGDVRRVAGDPDVVLSRRSGA